MNRKPRKILFLTGTRADFGKLQALIKAVDTSSDYECTVFATGMHMLEAYGSTIHEVKRANFTNVHTFMNQISGEPMDLILANTVAGLARFVHEEEPDMIIVHGDRTEALAAAIVGAFRNILIAHIEGGELSGTVDEVIRHAVSKLSHLHLVANDEAANRLRQMGESLDSIFVIGSPDLDAMNAGSLPSLQSALAHYEVPFDEYAIALLHPVTTEINQVHIHARNFVDALIADSRKYIVVYPNNDEGSILIINEYQRLRENPRFRVFPSIRFEYFLTFLKNMQLIVGNSSAGIREATFYGKPTVNIGSRQANRYFHPLITNVSTDQDSILHGLTRAATVSGKNERSTHFGDGNSLPRFMDFLAKPEVWATPKQKQFIDLPSMVN